MRQLNVAIIDSNIKDRNTYKNYCNQSMGLNCVLAVKSFEQFVLYRKASKTPDIILIDIEDDVSVDSNYAKKISKTKSILPKTELIVFTKVTAESTVIKSFNAGANGYLLKGLDRIKLEDYLLNTREGGAAVSPKIARLLVQRLNFDKFKSNADCESLSRRQLEIIELLADGLNNTEIANQLNISVNGVQYHVRIIYDKLKVRNKTELLKKYLTKNLL